MFVPNAFFSLSLTFFRFLKNFESGHVGSGQNSHDICRVSPALAQHDYVAFSAVNKWLWAEKQLCVVYLPADLIPQLFVICASAIRAVAWENAHYYHVAAKSIGLRISSGTKVLLQLESSRWGRRYFIKDRHPCFYHLLARRLQLPLHEANWRRSLKAPNGPKSCSKTFNWHQNARSFHPSHGTLTLQLRRVLFVYKVLHRLAPPHITNLLLTHSAPQISPVIFATIPLSLVPTSTKLKCLLCGSDIVNKVE